MKAAILVQQNAPLVVDHIELPPGLEYGQVLVKIYYSGICGAQLNEIDGLKGPDKFLPHLLGHEGSGIVEKIGAGVSTIKAGDHVVLHWKEGAGIKSATPTYLWKGRTVNAGWVTTFNEFAVVSENRVTVIPADFDMKLAPLFGCAITTAFGVIHNNAGLKCGESIVIFGSGGVGSAIAQAAAMTSACPIIMVDINDFKLEQSKSFGATVTINSRNEEVTARVLSILPGGADVVVDTTGIKSVRELAYELTNKEGRTIFVGVPRAGEKISIDSFPLHFTKSITGSHGGDARPEYDIPRLIRLQQQGKLPLESMITHTFPLDQINEAMALLRTGDTLRCLIKMNHD